MYNIIYLGTHKILTKERVQDYTSLSPLLFLVPRWIYKNLKFLYSRKTKQKKLARVSIHNMPKIKTELIP